MLGGRGEVGLTQSFQYELKWAGVRRAFYEPLRTLQEIGMYYYAYSTIYEDGRDVSWVYQGTGGYTEEPQFSIQVANNERQRFNVDVTLLAAYGGNAPSQIVRVATPMGAQSVLVSAGKPGVAHLNFFCERRGEIQQCSSVPSSVII